MSCFFCENCNCCFDNGILKLKLASSTNYIKNGDIIDIEYTVDNTESNLDINGMVVDLREIVEMSDGYGSHSKIIK